VPAVPAVFAPIATVLASIPDILAPVTTVFTAVESILEPIPQSAIMLRIADVFPAVADVFPPVPNVLVPIAAIFPSIADVFQSIPKVVAIVWSRALCSGRSGHRQEREDQDRDHNRAQSRHFGLHLRRYL
jgi:hypothetical protein